MKKTFTQLKEENAALELEAENNQNVTETEALDVENVQEEIEENAEESQKNDTEDGSKESDELEPWQQIDDEASNNDQTGFIPNSEAAKRRKQNQALRGEVKEKDSEIEILRKQVEELKAGSAPTAPVVLDSISERPTLESSGWDEDVYQNNLDKWNDERLEKRLKAINQSTQQEKAKQEANQLQQSSIDDHYARAQKLVESGKMEQSIYQSADSNVRRAMESVFPNAGDQTTDRIIATLNNLGEGSEKVIYSLGRNNKKLNELIGSIKADPSGLQMMAQLGKLHSEAQDPIKRRSNAPKPATKLSSDSPMSGSAGAVYKKWSKSTNVQERISLKRQAKAAGEDVSKW